MLQQLRRVLQAPHRINRIATLAEIRANKRLVRGGIGGALSIASPYEDFVASVDEDNPELAALLDARGPAEHAFSVVTEYFERRVEAVGSLAWPAHFNADPAHAYICYALARYLEPRTVVETGVAYGITTGVVLRALNENGKGSLTSIDLPAFGDPQREQAVLAVAPELRDCWSYRRGTSRHCLRKVLADVGECDLFLGDSANIATMQRFEWKTARSRLSRGGAAVFNNVSLAFTNDLQSVPDVRVWIVRQIKKDGATAVVLKRGLR